jgi:hypothetical protein
MNAAASPHVVIPDATQSRSGIQGQMNGANILDSGFSLREPRNDRNEEAL